MGNGMLSQEEINALLRCTFEPEPYKTEDSVQGSGIGCRTSNMEWYTGYRTSNTSSGSGPQLGVMRQEARNIMLKERAGGFRISDPRFRTSGMAWIAGLCTVLGTFLPARAVYAAGLTLDLGNTAGQQMSTSLLILLLLTVLSIAPAILILMTSFTRIVIVLSFVRNALGTQQLPPNQVLIGLSLFLTFFVMAPTWNQINSQALQPYLHNQISQSEALSKTEEPLRIFMFKQTREKDLQLFVTLAKMPEPKTYGDIPTYVLIPAFIISELKTAFQMGFAIFIPFMVIDMIVSSTLMSMGMLMLPPMTISLPFKILLFVLVDGWHLVVQSIVASFH